MDIALLEPTTTLAQIENLCSKAIKENYERLTVPPLFVRKAKELLAGHPIKTTTVIGYPYGWSAIESKVAEVILAMIDGADELDVVINITALQNSDWQYLAKELNTLMTIVRKQQRFINIIIESSILTGEDLRKCCDLYGAAGIDCLILSTGTSATPVSVETVSLVRSQLADQVKIKLFVAKAEEERTELYQAAGADSVGILVK